MTRGGGHLRQLKVVEPNDDQKQNAEQYSSQLQSSSDALTDAARLGLVSHLTRLLEKANSENEGNRLSWQFTIGTRSVSVALATQHVSVALATRRASARAR